MSREDFLKLADDVQNFYISTGNSQLQAMNEELNAVRIGEKTADDVKALIEESNAPDAVKEHLKSQVDALPAPEKDDGFITGAIVHTWDAVKNWLGNIAN